MGVDSRYACSYDLLCTNSKLRSLSIQTAGPRRNRVVVGKITFSDMVIQNSWKRSGPKTLDRAILIAVETVKQTGPATS